MPNTDISSGSFNVPNLFPNSFSFRGLALGLLWLSYGLIGWHLFQNYAYSQALLGVAGLLGFQRLAYLPQMSYLGQVMGSWFSQTVLRTCLAATVLFLATGFLLWSQNFDKLLLLVTSEVLVRLDFHLERGPALQGRLSHLIVSLSGLILGGVIATQG